MELLKRVLSAIDTEKPLVFGSLDANTIEYEKPDEHAWNES